MSDKAIIVTPKALKEIQRIQTSDPAANQGCLRVQVVGGGCSGMSYKLGFDKDPPGANDKVFEQEGGIKILIDAKSFLFLGGTELDFSDGLNGTGFTFNNPNAKRTCGCGTSFSA
jgi:iron-sulfur cluster assembly protein